MLKSLKVEKLNWVWGLLGFRSGVSGLGYLVLGIYLSFVICLLVFIPELFVFCLLKF
jgi:hypothetical protein